MTGQRRQGFYYKKLIVSSFVAGAGIQRRTGIQFDVDVYQLRNGQLNGWHWISRRRNANPEATMPELIGHESMSRSELEAAFTQLILREHKEARE